MPFDGIFIHHFIHELKQECVGKRIHRVICLNDLEYAFELQQHKTLLISVTKTNPHLRLSILTYLPGKSILSNFIKKHIEGGVIDDFVQYRNDRVLCIDMHHTDELGYLKPYKIILELTGKSANLIITDENYKILEAVRKSYLTDERIIQVGVSYSFPDSKKINPYEETSFPLFTTNSFEGVSSLTFQEILIYGSSILSRKTNPTLILGEKVNFYCFDLSFLEGKRMYFPTLSSLLEHYYTQILDEISESNEQKRTTGYIEKEIAKLKNKLEKQTMELSYAYQNQDLEEVANLLAANIHLVKPYQSTITVADFYHENQERIIPLNTSISPHENVNYYFNKVKKNKRTLVSLTKTIETTKQEIEYYECLLMQLDFVGNQDLKEMMIEIGMQKPTKTNTKPRIMKYKDEEGNEIFVGKNNMQNDYLTHTLAHSGDYFFHVKNQPGSHVILRGTLTPKSIELASTIAAYYSKMKNGFHVCVDYTDVKWVKKVKGCKGSFVTYTHEKNAYANPDLKFIETHATLDK